MPTNAGQAEGSSATRDRASRDEPTLHDDARSSLDPTPVMDGDDFAALVRSLADAVVIADAAGTITFWNDAATRLFGWSADDALGGSLELIIPERLRERHWAGFERVMATGHTEYGDRLLEVPALHRDGRRLSIAFTVTLLRREGATVPHAIAAVLRDDTERWQERRALRDELASLRSEQPHEEEAARAQVEASATSGTTSTGAVDVLTIPAAPEPRRNRSNPLRALVVTTINAAGCRARRALTPDPTPIGSETTSPTTSTLPSPQRRESCET